MNMARAKATYVCQNCGAVAARWAGRCDACGQWNTIVEENPEQPLAVAGGVQLPKGKSRRLEPLAGTSEPPPRIATGISELDRVTGGGFVPGSALLIGGDPGIGKSTLMLQVLARLAQAGRRAVYVSGEEGLDQIRLRAQRLGVLDAPLMLAAETNVSDIVATLRREKPEIVVIDSLQTLWTPVVESAPGTVSQLRAGAEAMVRLAKKTGAVMLLIGHVTKEGQIAGPRVVEHMVDAVLYFEGDRGHQYRILRAVKNRFGATDEIGVFEMAGHGLVEVPNPSRLFMGDAESQVPGAAVFAGVEGQRPLLVEMQALAVPTTFATPRRAVVGWDSGRLAMILAVLEARAGVRLGQHDVYLNVAGGMRVREPAADLAAAAALVSSLSGKAQAAGTVVFGEVALSGRVRAVPLTELRLREAAKLGFSRALVAEDSQLPEKPGLKVERIPDVAALAARLLQS